MSGRIFGIETEYALAAEDQQGRLLSLAPGDIYQHLEDALMSRGARSLG